MTRHFMHLHNRTGSICDEEGRELPDLQAARHSAIEPIHSLSSEEVRGGRLDLKGQVDILHETDNLLTVVPFAVALDMRLDDGE